MVAYVHIIAYRVFYLPIFSKNPCGTKKKRGPERESRIKCCLISGDVYCHPVAAIARVINDAVCRSDSTNPLSRKSLLRIHSYFFCGALGSGSTLCKFVGSAFGEKYADPDLQN